MVTAPTNLPNPALVKVVQIQTAEEMRVAIQRHLDKADALVMAAAVADYKPSVSFDQKIKKSEDDLNISLAKTTDILKTGTGSFVKVGFSAESQNLVENAKAKINQQKVRFNCCQ
ncbi:MAG: hypothetical protein Ct9H300mP11_17360 [Chloroflexota bacterium]|nr:MAG: hypothetical protein Ct9H300mP11_17360 [Chloroflexota bacterium]